MHDMVIEEGSAGGSMYIIEEGKVSIWFKGSKLRRSRPRGPAGEPMACA